MRHLAARLTRLPRTALHTATLCALAACSPVTRKGLEPLVTDRPDFTESTETVLQGMRQIEAGSTFSRTESEQTGSIGETLIRVGLAPKAELRIALNSYALSRAEGETIRGLEDMSLGAKIKLMSGGGDGSIKPTLSLIVASSLPTGASPFRAAHPQPEAKFLMAWDLTSRASFSSNVNYTRVSDVAGAYNEFAASGSLGLGLTDRLGSYLEYFTFVPRGVDILSSHYLNGGVTYGLTDNLQLDARSGFGLRRLSGPDYFFGIGVSRRW
jgi:Putative MetA-pathway of phenol degradation